MLIPSQPTVFQLTCVLEWFWFGISCWFWCHICRWCWFLILWPLRFNFVTTKRSGFTTGLCFTSPFSPKPRVVCLLQQSSWQSVLQQIIITFCVRVPFWVLKPLHVLRSYSFCHHISLCREIQKRVTSLLMQHYRQHTSPRSRQTFKPKHHGNRIVLRRREPITGQLWVSLFWHTPSCWRPV